MSLTISVESIRPAQAEADVLIIPVFDKNKTAESLPHKMKQDIVQLMREAGFSNEWGTATLFAHKISARASIVAVIGLGSGEPLARQMEAVRRGMGKITQEIRQHGLKNIAFSVWDLPHASELAAAAAEGAELATYRFVDFSERLTKQQQKRSLKQLSILSSSEDLVQVRQIIKKTETILRGVTLARDLVNRPADHASPEALVKVAREMVRTSKNLSLKIFDKAQAKKRGFNAFLAVAKGSENPPFVIHLTYKPKKKTTKKIFLIGKGVTFDSGGLSLKPADYMETMKMDMAGGAAVLGLFKVLEKLNPTIEIHGVIAACENMPSGSAYRPGDILKSKNGKSIEVANTDAEGRLTLADALAYAVEHKPSAIIDLATLTGACLVALGETVAGLFGNNENLLVQISEASSATGESVARLPMPPEYKPMLESHVADIRNISTTRWGGAITGAMFLREFVDDTPWAHLDIAGPAYVEHTLLPYYSHGATGYGVRLLADWLSCVEVN